METGGVPESPQPQDDQLIDSVFGKATHEASDGAVDADENSQPKKTKKGRKGTKKRPKKEKASRSQVTPQEPPVASAPYPGSIQDLSWPGGYDFFPADPYYGYTDGLAALEYGDYYYGSLEALGGLGGGLAYMDLANLENAPIAQPPDADSLHLLQDPAGMVQLESLVTAFDRLQGVANRGEFGYPLKSPLVFHEMFLRTPGVSSGVEEVRASLEERLFEDEADYESWEQLGHVWRHYGNVPRTMDCYRKALSVLPQDAHAVRSSLHINLAGLLDQMNYVGDALVVLHTFLDNYDVTTYEAENNFAVSPPPPASLSQSFCS